MTDVHKSIIDANEFSWHLVKKNQIENPRTQYLPNCWAIVLASLFSDHFCLTNNLKRCNLFSSLWVTSMMTGLYSEGENEKSWYNHKIRDNRSQYDLRLELCYPSYSNVYIDHNTSYKVFLLDYLSKTKVPNIISEFSYNESWLIGARTEAKYLGKSDCIFNTCCNSNVKIDTFNKVTCDKPSSYILPNIKFNFPKFNVIRTGIRRDNIIKKDIHIFNTCIKNLLVCLSKGPISMGIYYSPEYKTYIETYSSYTDITKIPIFEQESIYTKNGKDAHSICILGWGKEDDTPFWYIRDSNSKIYLKIIMHTKDNYNNNIIEALSSYIYLDNSEFKNDELTTVLIDNKLVEYTDEYENEIIRSIMEIYNGR